MGRLKYCVIHDLYGITVCSLFLVAMVSTVPFQVRSIFGQVIIAMAHHHYLELEGGHSLVEFVVKQCAINPEDKASMYCTMYMYSVF